jgi:hypothetical protein
MYFWGMLKHFIAFLSGKRDVPNDTLLVADE